MRTNRKLQRLHVAGALREGSCLALDKAQSHYLLNVLRMTQDAELLVFNGRDGEWLATVERDGKRASLAVGRQTRPQKVPPDVRLCLAPVKSAHLEFAVQKATELGASAILPVVTAYTQIAAPNLERMRANAVEAAEQCGALAVPDILEPVRMADWLQRREVGRHLVFCDEAAAATDALSKLRKIASEPVDILIGPEGGFSPEERETLLALPNIVPISLGPRVLRAETAALAALVLVQAARGMAKDASE